MRVVAWFLRRLALGQLVVIVDPGAVRIRDLTGIVPVVVTHANGLPGPAGDQTRVFGHHRCGYAIPHWRGRAGCRRELALDAQPGRGSRGRVGRRHWTR